MKKIHTIIPFKEEELDEYLDNTEKYYFILDFNKIDFNAETIINYIYNSRIKCSFENIIFNDKLEKLLLQYLFTNKILSIDTLNNLWIDILYYKLNNPEKIDINNEKQVFAKNFIINNSEIINELLSELYCLKIFLMNIVIEQNIEAEEKEFVNIGNNIISLRNDDRFWQLLSDVDSLNLVYYNYKNFDKSIFDGYKIAHYFYDEFSPLCLLKILDQLK